MGRYREKVSTFFTRLVNRFGRKQHPPFVSPSKSIILGPPKPQTSLVFELPDELILLILSYISSEPRTTDHRTRFRGQYGMQISGDHRRRVQFLRPLSVTCRRMRLRLMPWIWERLEVSPRRNWSSGEEYSGRVSTIANALHADTPLAFSVKFMTVDIPSNGTVIPLFVKCLEALQNLHTLEVMSVDDDMTSPLKNALKRVNLPQIQTLILPLAAHPLLRTCPNVEDIVCVVRYNYTSSDGFLKSLGFIRDSKVKRLAIPLVLWSEPSRFVAACPKLTELTIFYPRPSDAKISEGGIPIHPAESARTATLELVNACRALPDFDTLQIVHFPLVAPLPLCGCGRARLANQGASMKQRKKALMDEVNGIKDLAVDCLREPEAGCQEGEKEKEVERRKTVVRIVELRSDRPRPKYHLASVEVEDFEV